MMNQQKPAAGITGLRASGWIPFLAAVLSGGLAAAADWPQFLGPTRDGRSPETGLLRSWLRRGPPRLWEKPLGAGFSGPAVADDHLIVFHRQGGSELVDCLEPATGKEQWRFASPTQYQDDFGMDEGPRATPLIADGKVFTLGAEGQLHCLELASGRKLWERNLGADYRPRKGFFGVATSPLLEQGKIIINVGGAGAGIVAFDAATGQEAWRATDDEASYASPVAATLAGVRQIVAFTREGVVLLDPQTGAVRFRKRWRSRINASVNAASPLVVGDDVFFSACYGTGALLLRVRAVGADTVWKSDTVMSNHYSTCVHHDGYLYGFDGRQEEGARLRCIELATGNVRWTSERGGCGSMILAEGNLITLTEHGELLLVRATPERYDEMAYAPVLERPCRSPIALADGRLFTRAPKKLVCWNLKR
jgi:outer membrane protein assembly factor BamB